MASKNIPISEVADCLAGLYDQSFGGKSKGRYRISIKLLKQIACRRRLYEDERVELARALFERGFLLIDMDQFFVILNANTFVNYRRANEHCLGSLE